MTAEPLWLASDRPPDMWIVAAVYTDTELFRYLARVRADFDLNKHAMVYGSRRLRTAPTPVPATIYGRPAEVDPPPTPNGTWLYLRPVVLLGDT